jgi:inorganic pyrophosphatase
MTALDRLPPRSSQGVLRAVIETPQGSRNKVKFDPTDEAMRITESLPAGMSFPFDFGFIPGTKAEDGDPLDVLVLMDGPGYPGTLAEIKILGVILAEEQEDDGWVRNDRLIAVADGTCERGHLEHIRDLDPGLMSQIETFFETYSGLLGKKFRTKGLRGPRRAEDMIKKAAAQG